MRWRYCNYIGARGPPLHSCGTRVRQYQSADQEEEHRDPFIPATPARMCTRIATHRKWMMGDLMLDVITEECKLMRSVLQEHRPSMMSKIHV